MAKIESMKALARLKQIVASNIASWGYEAIARSAELELREEQLRQQELANMIAMASTPSACPFPSADVLNRIKELTNITKSS